MAITLEKKERRIYFRGNTYAVKDRIKAMGGHWDAEERAWWVGLALENQANELAQEQGQAPPAERGPDKPDDIRLTGKGIYKERTYYLGARTRDGMRIRCLTLPDKSGKFLDFWVKMDLVKIVKDYQPRQFRGRTEYTTLGSIARFVAREQRNREEGGAICAACGRSGDLVRDMEDGLLKHYSCCDMPE